jgi:hypothetical protein
MSSLDGNNLFSSGPHSFRPLAWQRQLQRRSFPGLDGELVLDMGMRSRRIVQQGRLQASSASSLAALVAAIEHLVDVQPHLLLDNYGQTYSKVILETFEPTTPFQQGRGFWCDYTVNYLQLP